MELLYNTTKGAYYVKIMAIPSFIAYFEGVFVSILISIDQEKKLVLNTIITNLVHLIIIFMFVSIPAINALGLVIAFSITMIISPLILMILCIKNHSFKVNLKHIVICLISYLTLMSLSIFL